MALHSTKHISIQLFNLYLPMLFVEALFFFFIFYQVIITRFPSIFGVIYSIFLCFKDQHHAAFTMSECAYDGANNSFQKTALSMALLRECCVHKQSHSSMHFCSKPLTHYIATKLSA